MPARRRTTLIEEPPEPGVLSPVTNDGEHQIALSAPYTATIVLEGTTPILFHRWSVEAVKEKAEAAKGSAAKKSDDIESYVWRNEKSEICIPVEYVRQSIINAAKYEQDPRSPRKSAMDLFKAAITADDELATTHKRTWDFVDQRRVQVQRSGVTRSRPALATGWTIKFSLTVLLPEYVPPHLLHKVLSNAGRLVGIADFRPSYGRFQINSFETGSALA